MDLLQPLIDGIDAALSKDCPLCNKTNAIRDDQRNISGKRGDSGEWYFLTCQQGAE
jgi:hypothetical protein